MFATQEENMFSDYLEDLDTYYNMQLVRDALYAYLEYLEESGNQLNPRYVPSKKDRETLNKIAYRLSGN